MTAQPDELLKAYLLSEIRKTPIPGTAERGDGFSETLSGRRIDEPAIFIGSGTCGKVAGASAVKQVVEDYLSLREIPAAIIETGCTGYCSMEPVLDIQLPGKARISFRQVTPALVPDLLDAVLNHSIPPEHVLGQYRGEGLETWGKVPFMEDLRFFRKQQRILLSHTGLIDPCSIADYIAAGGYRTFLKTIFSHSPEQVCDFTGQSGLRGRGGGGYPAAMKWKAVLNAAADQKYLICNADESDPGSYVARTLLEGDPHKVIEGMALAAYASGAGKAYLVVRHDYSLAISRVKQALKQARQLGLTGPDVFGSGVDLSIQLWISPGAFVCGEETALLQGLEGKRGTPQSKPPYPVLKGLSGKPTVVNNIETLALVPSVLENGPQWFASLGSPSFPGTKIFTLSGKVVNKGLAEVPTGTTFRDLVYHIGEGICDQRAFKGLHLGGPLGQCTDAGILDRPADPDLLAGFGLSLGSGGMVVLDDRSCIPDLAGHFLQFLQQESCGKCIPCREGTRRMAAILEQVTRRPDGEQSHQTLERFKGVMQLENLATVMRETSLCGLGKNAPNAVLSSLKHFRAEYEEHLFDRHCSAGICTHLRIYIIDTEKCTGCGACARKCPAAAIIGTPTHPHFIVEGKCTGCGICVDTCKFVAISVK